MKGFILCSMLLLTAFAGRTQIVIGESEKVEKKEEKKPKEPKKMDTLSNSTSIYFVTNWSKTSRVLTINPEMTADSLGERAFENQLSVWSFGVGIRTQLTKNLLWDGGISLYRNGESYNFIGSDTTFSYQNYYTYLAMPIRLNYIVGKDFQFYAGAGLVPQMFSGFRQETQWTTSTNSTGHETIKSKIGYNSFVLSSIFNVGFIMNFQNNWSLIVSPEARIQLTSSYLKLNDFIHKGRAYGITFGLIRNL